MDNAVDSGNELVESPPAGGGDFLQSVDKPDRRVTRSRQHLEDLGFAAVHDEEIGKRSPYIYTYEQSHIVLF